MPAIAALGGAVVPSSIAAPNRARTSASIRSVFARRPVMSANRRDRYGFTTATWKPAPWR